MRQIKFYLELLKEKFELIDPLMIFPSHRRLKREFGKMNILLDRYKLKATRKVRAERRKTRRKED